MTLTALQIEGLNEARGGKLLRDNPDLILLLEEAADQLARFIPDSRLTIEMLPDPDHGGEDQLFLGVHTALPEDAALVALGRFDQEWWVPNARRGRGLVCIDLSDE